MNRLILASLLLFYGNALAGAQDPARKLFLLVKNCKADESICHTQELVSYQFENGEFVSKELILSSPTDRVRFDLGGNIVFQNRYVITTSGDVVDLAKKKVIHESVGQFVGQEGYRIFIKVNGVDVAGVFVFDISTSNYSRLTSPNIWEREGTLSPDHRKVARFEWIARKNKPLLPAIVVEEIGKKRIVLTADLGAEGDTACSDRFTIPFTWIDNDEILSQRSNGDLIILTLDRKVEPLFKVPCERSPGCPPRFSRFADGRIRYCGYLLNPTSKSFREDRDVGAGFELVSGQGAWIELYFEGRKIGRVWGSAPHTASGFIALAYADEGANLGYPKGVKVWNRIKNDWTTIDIPWGATIIGWIYG